MSRSATILIFISLGILSCGSPEFAGYTTQGSQIVDRATGEPVHLLGFGIGGWLLPEGYMWGLRTLDRPRQFEAAIEDLVGPEQAAEFWRLYHENYTTAEDFRAMSVMGVNSVRIALLASELMPREQPATPPYLFDPDGFRFLDSVVTWAERFGMGVIWDMHGAPGAQNAENISDSDGEARLWTEPDIYWPRLDALWREIAGRYAGHPRIIGYDLLNEPLLLRYDGVEGGDLRTLYVQLTESIREIDAEGVIFIEGDDWAQNFDELEPIDWDPHLALAFHSYPPTSTAAGLERWDTLRKRYNVPLWHGETGEVGAPFDLNRKATEYLRSADVGWSWWTHKKLNRQTQPWFCPPTEGFQRILEYWQGRGDRPTAEQAREWLFEQARRLRSDYCIFSSEMVSSLDGLDPEAWHDARPHEAPAIFRDLRISESTAGNVAVLTAQATGFPLTYSWIRDGEPVEGLEGTTVRFVTKQEGDGGLWQAVAYNELGADTSSAVRLVTGPFAGYEVPRGDGPREMRAIDRLIVGADRPQPEDLSASWGLWWNDEGLHGRVEVVDDVLQNADNQWHHNDGIELYVDLNNAKAQEYDADDAQIRVIRQGGFSADRGSLPQGLLVSQKEVPGGYVVDFTLPGSFEPGRMFGMEIHVVDNDLDRREHKLAWKGRRDDAYRRASSFDTMRLMP